MSPRAGEIYDLLLDHARSAARLEEFILGLTWSYCQLEDEQRQAPGMAMSPPQQTRLLDWPGTLVGRQASELADWLKSWNPHRAVVGMAVVNAVINAAYVAQENDQRVPDNGPANLGVFQYFLPQMAGTKVVVVGRYPGLEQIQQHCEIQVLERQAGAGDLPDPACEFVLPEADWVFLTASSLTNKTAPRLLQLSRDARVVLMGPGVPWLTELQHFGVDYLAGVEVLDRSALRQCVMQGGGRRVFEQGIEYRIRALSRRAQI